jgi:hypothetical protein
MMEKDVSSLDLRWDHRFDSNPLSVFNGWIHAPSLCMKPNTIALAQKPCGNIREQAKSTGDGGW